MIIKSTNIKELDYMYSQEFQEAWSMDKVDFVNVFIRLINFLARPVCQGFHHIHCMTVQED